MKEFEGFSEMLKSGFDTKEEHDTAVNSILMSGKTMLQLVNDILDVGKLESGRMEIVPEMTGEKLVSAIRADSTLASLKVYLFTADAEMKDTYAEKGFDGILLKPANLEALKNLLS